MAAREQEEADASQEEAEQQARMQAEAQAAAHAQSQAARKATAEVEAGVEQPPDVFTCPITQDLIVDPVLAMDGHTYERRVIEDWLVGPR